MKTDKRRHLEFEYAGRSRNGDGDGGHGKLKNKRYQKELKRLQTELVKLQEWIKHEGLKVVVLFEGRDAAARQQVVGLKDEPERARAQPMVFPALHRPPARGRGAGAV